jgi:DNA-binding Lrp family transcriptional regulator
LFKKDQKEKKKQEILNYLLKDPTESIRNLSKKTEMNRRTVYQIKKDLEKDHIIWGYTTVIDEQQRNRSVCLAQFQTRPFTKQFADLIHQRLTKDLADTEKYGIRILDIDYLTGEYTVHIKFSAPSRIIAQKYFETLRVIYKDHFLNEPIISYLNASFVQMGKVHPTLKQTLYSFVPTVK